MAANTVTTEQQRHEVGGTSSAGEVETATAPSAMRRRERQPTRRNRPRVDDLERLHTRIDHPEPANIQHLRKIAYSLFQIDLWFLNTLLHHSMIQSMGPDTYEKFEKLLDPDLAALNTSASSVEASYELDAQLGEYLGRLSEDQILKSVRDLRTSKFSAVCLHLHVTGYRSVKTEQGYAVNQPNLTIPEGWASCKTPQDYLHRLVWDVSFYRRRLKAVVMECRSLLRSIQDAMVNEGLDDMTLEQLKQKLEALQEYFPEACEELNETPQNLINSSHLWWWDPEAEPERVSKIHQAPTDAVEAYSNSANVNTTLSFLVPTVCLLSCVPAALAWSHAPPQVGRVKDANFYQLVSSAAMQLLGIITLIWPTVFHVRLARLSWVWTWILATVSACCTVAAVVLYALVPTSWSALLSFGGSLSHALVLLQFIHAISKSRTS